MITLTNGVQVPENAVQLRTTAAVDGYYVTQPLQLVQYDETLPVAAVQLTYQNQPYIPPTGAELNVRMGKPDGTTVYNPCLGVDSSGIVYFVFTQQMTIVAGTGTLTVEITDSGVKNSAPIIAEIRPNPVPEGSIESADEFLTLQEILAEAEKWGQIVQTNASNIQQVVDNLEDIQNAAENAQAAAESAAAAKKAAQEALGFRTFFSAVRPDANGSLDPSRPMVVGPAASVEIESKGDRIQSVTALGFTQQAGTGDPSPTNVRAITNGGMQANLFPGFTQLAGRDPSTGELTPSSSGNVSSDLFPCKANQNYYVSVKTVSAAGLRVWFWNNNGDFLQSTSITSSAVSPSGTVKTPNNAAQMAVTSFVLGGNLSDFTEQLVVYGTAAVPYTPYTGAEYGTVVQIQSGEYRATCLPLTAPLCEGDSVVSLAKSGCDKVVTFDGSEDWTLALSGNGWLRAYTPAAGCVPGTAVGDWLRKGTVDEWNTNSGIGYVVTLQSGNIGVCVPTDKTTIQDFKAILAAHPLTVWYRSTNYTDAADIPVSLETHVRAVRVFDGTEAWKQQSAEGQIYVAMNPFPKPYSNFYCTEFKYRSNTSAGGAYLENNLKINPTGGQFGDLIGPGLSTTEVIQKWKEHLAAQYAAGTPVTIVYQLATSITYAHEAVVLESATGDQLTYTVTGQSGGTVSVALKPFQDGGNAAKLDGLTLLAIKESMTPVGYIFSWAPVDDGPDLSTPAAVAEYFGFGTWQAYGTGQVLVGVDSGQTEFASVGQTGGEKTHTLTTQELPEFMPNPAGGGSWLCIGGIAAAVTQGLAQPGTAWAGENVGPVGGQTIGGNQPHNNLQPYITVYRWQRVK